MAFALPLLVQLFDAIDGTVQWLGGASYPQQTSTPAPTPVAPHAHAYSAQHADPSRQTSKRPSTQHAAPQRTWSGPTRELSGQRALRVVRTADQRRHHVPAGRMLISGRIADVCAEHDRLAADKTRH